MKLSTSLVAIKKITSSVPRSNFADDELEQVAKLILTAEGVINPIVIRRASINTFEVVDGHFEYYAAERAREVDPRKGEMIGVFIIEPENEEPITEQIKILRKQKTDVPGKQNFDSNMIEKRLTNFESRLEKRINELLNQATDKQKLEAELKEVKSSLANKIEPLEIFNTINIAELAFRLKSAGLNEKTAIKIAESVEKERKEKKFSSLSDIVARVKVKNGKRQVKGISSDKMMAIIDSWSPTLFV